MKVAAAHCNPKKQPALNHNDRTNDSAKTITKDLTHLNEYSCSSDEVRKNIDILYKEAQESFSNYCANKNGLTKAGKPKGLQNFTKKDKCYHEFIYEISEDTTMEQCQELTQKIAELTGFTPLQVVVHRDEIHENTKGEKQTHFHAHAVFFTLDKETGLQLARQEASLNKANLSKIQTLSAESLRMERGANRYEKGEQQPQYIQDYKDYARFKEQETKLLREIDTKTQTLAHLTKTLADMEQRLKASEQELKAKEAELEKREKEYQTNIEALEQKHTEAFDKLLKESNAKKSLWKNIITLGGHNERVEKEFQIQKQALRATLTQAEDKALQQVEHYKREKEEAEKRLKESQEAERQARKESQRLRESAEQSMQYQTKYLAQMRKYERFLKDNMQENDLKECFPKLHSELLQEQLEKSDREFLRRYATRTH
ncbi:mobilization protein [Helicobacter sp.]|uniref:mobilization protein n=2 Tax=Helicobacter sp. TaxID=218 RepID=UPI0019C90873|nr:mobilization protein [Helicobacter sp.]MBD5164221.1 mobilization protein [Helicobacter sp.]